MKRVIIISLTMFALIPLLAWGLRPEEHFLRAGQHYAKADYDSAIIHYQSILDQGFHGASVYYNMGNAYFKLRKFPDAILFYEKALKLNPGNEDIRHNLRLANAMIVDKIDPVPEFFLKQWWTTFYNLLPADMWAWISIVLFGLTLIMAWLFFTARSMFWRKTGFFAGLAILFMFIGSFGLASQKYYYTQRVNEAIVFVPTITVKSAPSASGVDLFVLHEGSKVRLLEENGDWQKIRIANGSVGWIPAETLKGI
ncbi:MAG TPA: tetratricopeptide repeat protein [Bacteroidales bacterium]|nr:tetratricopeptide repeat protein [Bacteroidales bacterium]